MEERHPPTNLPFSTSLTDSMKLSAVPSIATKDTYRLRRGPPSMGPRSCYLPRPVWDKETNKVFEEAKTVIAESRAFTRPDFRDIVPNSGHLRNLSLFCPDFRFSSQIQRVLPCEKIGAVFLLKILVKSVPILSRFCHFSGSLSWKIVKLSRFVLIFGHILGCPDFNLA